MQAILGCTSEAKWLRHARAHPRHLFPYLPQQPGCNKRLRKAAGPMQSVNPIPAITTSVWNDDVWAVDSTPVQCGRRTRDPPRPPGRRMRASERILTPTTATWHDNATGQTVLPSLIT
ncbi:hypothetical protein ACF07T_38830 [Streptomyces sp. NPDC015184]|uniref:hypothetical protein n=1 Tax=Streptomyces sp. NPDC015184 TaxID=3364946 RepID=UPI0036F8A779